MSFDEHYFARQLVLEGLGRTGQARLAGSSVVVAGLGGTGSVAAEYLALAGVGKMRLVDRDVVSYKDLHRQPIYALSDVGRSKAEAAAAFLAARAPSVKVSYRAESVGEQNSTLIVGAANLVVDCLDNMPARWAINRACVNRQIPLVHTGAIGWEASEAIFWAPRTACLECLFPRPQSGRHSASDVHLPSCEEVGTLGPISGAVSALGVLDAIKLLIGEEPASLRRMLVWDSRRGAYYSVGLKRREDCNACGRGSSPAPGQRAGRSTIAIELCGGREFYISGAFPPRSFSSLRRRLQGRSVDMGRSIVQARVGEAEVSIFRCGGLLVKGVSSPEDALAVVPELGLEGPLFSGENA